MDIQEFKFELEELVAQVEVSEAFVLDSRSVTVAASYIRDTLICQLRKKLQYREEFHTETVQRTTGVLKVKPWNLLKAAVTFSGYCPTWVSKHIRLDYERIPVDVKIDTIRRYCPHMKTEPKGEHFSFMMGVDRQVGAPSPYAVYSDGTLLDMGVLEREREIQEQIKEAILRHSKPRSH